MGSAPSPPPVPSATQIAGAQSKANIQSAEQQAGLNNVNQSGPLGSLQYQGGNIDPNTGLPTSWNATTVSPFQQGINNNINAFNNATPIDAQNAIQQLTAGAQKYMTPFFNTQQSNLNSQLQNEGFSMNDAAAQLAQRNLQNQQSDYIAGNANQFAPTVFGSYMLPEQAAAGAAGATTGNFVNTPQTGVSPTNVNQAYQTQTNAEQYDYGQQMQNYSAMMGGLFSIPSAMLGGWARGGFGMPGGSANA